MAEKQSAHRIAIESKVIDRQQSRSNRGQHYALIVTLVALVGAFWAIMTGHDSAGGTIGTTAIGSVAIAFITGQYQQNANLREKKPN